MVVVELDLEHRVRQGLGDLALHLDLLFFTHAAAEGSGLLRPRKWLCRALLRGTSAPRSAGPRCANRLRELLRRDLVGRVDPAVEIGADDPLRRRVRLGRAAREPLREPHPLLVQVVVGDDPVDHAPALERPRRRRGRRSSRTRAPAPGPARSAIRCVPPAPGVSPTTASTRPNFDDSLGPDQVAAQRHLEPGRQAEAVDQRQGRDLAAPRARCTPSISGAGHAARPPPAIRVDDPLEGVDVDAAA